MTEEQEARLNYLKEFVALRVDEYTERADGEDVPELPVGDVEKELHNAARSVLRRIKRITAFSSMKHQEESTLIQNKDRGSTLIPVAEDYLRFVSVQMKDWTRAASRIVLDTSLEYQNQMYEHKRATKEFPMAALVPYHGENGTEKAIEVFPAASELTALIYVPETEAYDLHVDLEDALVWKATSAILIVMRLPSMAQAALAEYENAIEELNNGLYGEEG